MTEEPATTTALIAHSPTRSDIDSLVEQLEILDELHRRVLKEGIDYDSLYDGVDNTKGSPKRKPSILKPGLEKLAALHHLADTYSITLREFDGGHREYEVICTLISKRTGEHCGSGVGTCTTLETKYRYRKSMFSCPDCGSSAIIQGKAEWGGGWICWKKKGGCGAKFPEHQFSGSAGLMENPNIAETYNTVLKMARIRSYRDAVLTSTSSSGLFTQDMEQSGVEQIDAEIAAEVALKTTEIVKKTKSHTAILRERLRAITDEVDVANRIVWWLSNGKFFSVAELTTDETRLEVIAAMDNNNAIGLPDDSFVEHSKNLPANVTI